MQYHAHEQTCRATLDADSYSIVRNWTKTRDDNKKKCKKKGGSSTLVGVVAEGLRWASVGTSLPVGMDRQQQQQADGAQIARVKSLQLLIDIS
jgi:hypothetical protein